jgi:hypothetical protein
MNLNKTSWKVNVDVDPNYFLGLTSVKFKWDIDQNKGFGLFILKKDASLGQQIICGINSFTRFDIVSI